VEEEEAVQLARALVSLVRGEGARADAAALVRRRRWWRAARTTTPSPRVTWRVPADADAVDDIGAVAAITGIRPWAVPRTSSR